MASEAWLRDLQQNSGLPLERLRQLFERYGARAAEIARYIANGTDRPLSHHPRYSRREIEFILQHEKVERLDDLLLRRTLIAMLGESTRDLLHELADVSAKTLGWPPMRKAQEIEQTLETLQRKHRVAL